MIKRWLRFMLWKREKEKDAVWLRIKGDFIGDNF